MAKVLTADVARRCAYALVLAAVVAPLSILGCDKTPPAAAASASTDAPAGYTVEVSTDSGKSLVTQKSNVTTVTAALLATFPDLAAYFGNRPTIGSAYQDAHDPTTGGATFGATFNGQAVRGIVSCKLHDGGASVAVVFGRTDAPKADWEKLMAPPAPQTDAGAPAAANPTSANAAQTAGFHEYDYPDGTGSIQIPDGWTMKGNSAINAAMVAGPADQTIFLHNSRSILTPDSPQVAQREQMDARWAQMNANSEQRGLQPIPRKPLPPLMVAPLTKAADAVPVMISLFSKSSEFNNGPSLSLDRVISTQDAPCQLQGGTRAIVTFAFTKTLNGQSTAYRQQLDLITSPVGNTAWMYFGRYSAAAPDATFDHDLPIMMAIVQSEKVNQDRAMQVGLQQNQQAYQAGQQMLAAQQSQFQAMNNMYKQNAQTQQNIHDEQQAQTQAGYDAHNQQFRDDQLQRSRNAADFNESIIGTRTIYDTVTGQSGYANLTDVNGVVDSLNQAALDPNRFVQIPLRDQLYPLPGK